MITRSKALKIRSLAMDSAAEMDDVGASSVPEMYPKLKQDGGLVSAGTRLQRLRQNLQRLLLAHQMEL